MACVVSVKRPHDFDPYMSPENSVKRMKQGSPKHTGLPKPSDLSPDQGRLFGKSAPSTALEDYLRQEFGLRTRTDDGSSEVTSDGYITPTAGAQDVPSAGQPYFSLKQIRHVFGRLLFEHTVHLEEKFEKVLQDRLHQQYVAFVNFTHDQIHRQLDASGTPSYIS